METCLLCLYVKDPYERVFIVLIFKWSLWNGILLCIYASDFMEECLACLYVSDPYGRVFTVLVCKWSFMFFSVLWLLCLCACLCICTLWSPAGKGQTSWLSFVVSTVSLSLSHWYPGSGVVLDCIDSWSLHPYLLMEEFYCTCTCMLVILTVHVFVCKWYLRKAVTYACT